MIVLPILAFYSQQLTTYIRVSKLKHWTIVFLNIFIYCVFVFTITIIVDKTNILVFPQLLIDQLLWPQFSNTLVEKKLTWTFSTFICFKKELVSAASLTFFFSLSFHKLRMALFHIFCFVVSMRYGCLVVYSSCRFMHS